MRRGEVGAETAQPGATPRVQFVPRQVSLEGKARHATRAQKRPYARVATCCCSPTVPRSARARSRHKNRDKSEALGSVPLPRWGSLCPLLEG